MVAVDLIFSLALPALAVPASSAIAAFTRRTGEELDAETHAAAAVALVLAWLQAGGMILLTLGALRAGPVIAWIAIGVVAAFAAARRVTLPALRPAHALLIVPLVGYLLLATVPPWDRDEMVYHLALPRQFAAAARWVRPDDNIFASLPLGWESALSMLYALGSDGEPLVAPRLVGAWTAGAAALATTGLARALGARVAWLAGGALLLVPTFVEFGSSAYDEPYLILLVTLALGLVARTVAGARAFVLPAAGLAGVAASVKYPGLAMVGILAFAMLIGSEPASLRAEPVRRAARFLGVALLVACPFYVRNLLQRGNPFFPMGFELLGGRGWDPVRAEAYWETLRAYGEGDGLTDVLALPVRIFLARDLEQGFQGSIGPVVGAGALSAALLFRRGGPEGAAAERLARAAVALFAGVFFVFWMLTVRQARFFLPAVPALLALLACGIDRIGAAAPRVAAAALVGSAAWGAPLYATVWTRQLTSAWITGALDRDALLARVLPQSYEALRGVAAVVPPEGRVWLVWTRAYTYYLTRPYRLDCVFEGWRFEALVDASPDAATLIAALRVDGITHVLVNERFFLRGESADTRRGRTARLRKRFAARLSEGVLVEAKRWGSFVLYRVGDLGER
jgi:hypothetical protein